MKKICFLGECMVELKGAGEGMMSQSFAGDVYNSAVYLKRCFPDIDTSVVTAVGKDKLSMQMLERFEKERLNTRSVFKHPEKAPGMYLIENDETGERSFTYWRNDSAAKHIVTFLDDAAMAELKTADMFFFSGISLAILTNDTRPIFWSKLEILINAGVTIVFDPNYRARLWDSKEQAEAELLKALSLSDIALPGVEDFSDFYDIKTAEDLVSFCEPFNIDELIVKNGPESVITRNKIDGVINHTVVPVKTVVDTTSAGDAFNGTFLGAKLSGKSDKDAIQQAAKAAGIVIQHPGAIAPEGAFKQAMKELGY